MLGAGAPAARSGSVTRPLATSCAAAGVAAWRPSAVSPPRSLAGGIRCCARGPGVPAGLVQVVGALSPLGSVGLMRGLPGQQRVSYRPRSTAVDTTGWTSPAGRRGDVTAVSRPLIFSGLTGSTVASSGGWRGVPARRIRGSMPETVNALGERTRRVLRERTCHRVQC